MLLVLYFSLSKITSTPTKLIGFSIIVSTFQSKDLKILRFLMLRCLFSMLNLKIPLWLFCMNIDLMPNRASPLTNLT